MHYSPMPITSKQPKIVDEEIKCLYICLLTKQKQTRYNTRPQTNTIGRICVRVCLITANKAFICTTSLHGSKPEHNVSISV